MTSQRRQRSLRSRVLWGAAIAALIVIALLLLYWQLAVQPRFWDVITRGSNY
ncbi:MAG: hypothetical protein ACR2K4_09525 [Candidatus Limnocylindria bacterium]